MDSYNRSEHVRKRLERRSFLKKTGRYILATGALVALAYGADKCNASKSLDNCFSKAKEGIEYVVDEI